MHDQTGSYGSPQLSGEPQYGAPQYGAPTPQQQYGAPPPQQYGAAPQQHYGAPAQPYGAPPQYGYGGPQYNPYGAPQYHQPGPRPGGGTVITAGIIQIVQASLFVLLALGILLVADVVNSAGDEFDRQSGADVSDTTDEVSMWVAVAGLLLLAAAIFMIVLAAVAMRGRRWAAITSVVLQALAVLASVVSLAQSDAGDSPGFSVVFLLASVTVVVLFLLPASTAYFADRSAARV